MSFGDMFSGTDPRLRAIVENKGTDELAEMLHSLRALVASGKYTIPTAHGTEMTGDLVRTVLEELERRGVKA